VKRWFGLGRWLGAHLAVGALGIGGMAGLDLALTALKRWVFLRGPLDVTLFLGLSGLWVGALLGGGQRWALKARGGWKRWVLGSGLGSALGVLGLWGLFWAVGPERLIPHGPDGMNVWIWVSAGIGLGIGWGAGVGQWILGRDRGRGAWAWMVGSAWGGAVAGWGIGVALQQLGEEWIERWGVMGWMGLGMAGGALFAWLTAWGLPSDPLREGVGE